MNSLPFLVQGDKTRINYLIRKMVRNASQRSFRSLTFAIKCYFAQSVDWINEARFTTEQ